MPLVYASDGSGRREKLEFSTRKQRQASIAADAAAGEVNSNPSSVGEVNSNPVAAAGGAAFVAAPPAAAAPRRLPAGSGAEGEVSSGPERRGPVVVELPPTGGDTNLHPNPTPKPNPRPSPSPSPSPKPHPNPSQAPSSTCLRPGATASRQC